MKQIDFEHSPDNISGLHYTSPDYLVDLYKSKMKSNTNQNILNSNDNTIISNQSFKNKYDKAIEKQPEIENDPKDLLKEHFEVDLSNSQNIKTPQKTENIIESFNKSDIYNSFLDFVNSTLLLKIIIYILIILLF
jgi:hypothetical protein